MGILNVTPDSFSDGGKFVDVNRAVDHAMQMWGQGADSIDIGGESTRPNADIISPLEEIDRILPVIEILKKENVVISVDTRNAETMRAALQYNVEIINDVSALTHDINSIDTIKNSNAIICLMHMVGTPQTMQSAPYYDDVVHEVKEFLSERIQTCVNKDIDQNRLWIDVGIGFGKNLDHNLELLRSLDVFQDLGCPLMLGTSRKSFIEKICGNASPDQRLGGSIASIINGYELGVNIFRVHDVMETKQALDVWRAITES
jgi:dihydropteroate synthase